MAYTYKLSSGVFGLPENAAAVDWLLLNDTSAVQPFKVTVFGCPIGERKKRLPPGPVELTVDPQTVFHNANGVGPGQPFQHGIPIEVVVWINNLKVLPTVEIWQDAGATVIPGTRIGPSDFIRL